MSYIKYPRLHFSGGFKASPSTINNAPNNYDPLVYPSPNELTGAELYWNPKGDGGFELVDCVITRIDYDETTSATDSSQDSLIGQPIVAIKTGNFPLPAAMVDLDPYQQNVSEIWAMSLQIGDSSNNLTGAFAPISFYAIWQQCQSPDAPHSSASGSGVYQSTLKNVTTNGDISTSPCLKQLAGSDKGELSINFNVFKHNNQPPILSFNDDTFKEMAKEPKAVPPSVLDKIKPMQTWVQNKGKPPGDLPVQDFVVLMLQQILPLDEYNANVEKIIKCSTAPNLPYVGFTPEPFLFGSLTGTVGDSSPSSSDYFTPTRMLCPVSSTGGSVYFAPFVTGDDGTSITLNLGNSLSSTTPDFTPYTEQLGDLYLVAFPGGEISTENAVNLAQIPYQDPDFITKQAGFFSHSDLGDDYSTTPLGIISKSSSGAKLVATENPQGYYMRADQFVYRMNPGDPTAPDNPRGSTNQTDIHVLQWGKPVPAGVELEISLMLPKPAKKYTSNTLGTGGTLGIDCVSIPQDILSIDGQKVTTEGEQLTVTVTTDDHGVATFDLACRAPGNPRKFIDGQIYLLEYQFKDAAIQSSFVQDQNDKISILVYDEITDLQGEAVLNKWGRLYKIMNFLTDDEKIQEISFRNIIKQMLEKPFSDVKHMPLTRDLGKSARTKVINWIDSLNNQS